MGSGSETLIRDCVWGVGERGGGAEGGRETSKFKATRASSYQPSSLQEEDVDTSCNLTCLPARTLPKPPSSHWTPNPSPGTEVPVSRLPPAHCPFDEQVWVPCPVSALRRCWPCSPLGPGLVLCKVE